MHSNHFGIYRTFHQWRGFCSHSTRIERDSGVFLRWYHVMSTCKANTLKGCCHWSCSSHVCNDHIFFQQHWPCIGTYTVQSKTEKRSFTEVTVVTTRLKGTVVTIFSKNLKIKKLFPPIDFWNFLGHETFTWKRKIHYDFCCLWLFGSTELFDAKEKRACVESIFARGRKEI